jgi:hypothetical protein
MAQAAKENPGCRISKRGSGTHTGVIGKRFAIIGGTHEGR